MTEAVLADGSAPPVRSAPQRVIAGVLDHIRARGLDPGDPLPSEQALGVMFHASRAVVRTALAALAALRMVEIVNGRNARVGRADHAVLAMMLGHAVQTDPAGLAHFLEARRAVELRAASLAAVRRSPLEAARLAELCELMGGAITTPLRLMHHDLEFHRTVAEASRNPLLALLVSTFRAANGQVWPLGWATRRSETDRREVVAVHANVADAIAGREPRAAEAAMASHFDLTVRALLAAGLL